MAGSVNPANRPPLSKSRLPEMNETRLFTVKCTPCVISIVTMATDKEDTAAVTIAARAENNLPSSANASPQRAHSLDKDDRPDREKQRILNSTLDFLHMLQSNPERTLLCQLIHHCPSSSEVAEAP